MTQIVYLQLCELLSQFISRTQVTEALDYGSGEWFPHLRAGHRMKLQAYDPANPLLADRPSPSQLVVCLDIDSRPDGTLDALQALASDLVAVAFRDPRVWLPLLMERWDLEICQRLTDAYMAVLSIGDHDTCGTGHGDRELDATRRLIVPGA